MQTTLKKRILFIALLLSVCVTLPLISANWIRKPLNVDFTKYGGGYFSHNTSVFQYKIAVLDSIDAMLLVNLGLSAAEVYHSTDGGETWIQEYAQDIQYTYSIYKLGNNYFG